MASIGAFEARASSYPIDLYIMRRREQACDSGARVQLVVDAAMAIVQLSDPEHFNTFSSGLGEDTRLAMSRLQALPGVASVVLQGTGAHFSAGGNPWSLSFGMSTPAASTASLRELYAGFVQLRALPVPIICGVHGTVIGGGVAACMHADYLVAEIGRASCRERV